MSADPHSPADPHPPADPHSSAARDPIRESLRIAGEKVSGDRVIEVRHPYSGEIIGTVPKATLADVKRALEIGRNFHARLTRAPAPWSPHDAMISPA
jgi:hypothetical protein